MADLDINSVVLPPLCMVVFLLHQDVRRYCLLHYLVHGIFNFLERLTQKQALELLILESLLPKSSKI